MQQLLIPNVFMWSVWQPDRNVFFNSYLIRRDAGNVLIDPLAAPEEDLASIDAMGGVALIVITNRDHERKAREFALRFGARIAAGASDAPLLSGPVDLVLHAGDEPFEGARVIAFEGLKSPGEIALHLSAHKAAIVGDALWGDPAGTVRLLPDAKLLDPPKAVLSLRQLWALKLETLLVGDGAPIFHDADRVIGDYLQSRSDAYVNKINLDEIEPERFDDAGGKYAAIEYEAGFPIGARRLGYNFVTLEPGARLCPMHSHALEEEVFIVWEGEPTIHTPRGEFECRRGDVIAFPVGDVGMHQLLNKSDKPCTVFALGNAEPNEVAFYPDSNKVLVRSRKRLILRAEPRVDYYDGE
jgi:uncharacterized cupin superfamily protein/glyoxylase-like metal-dependent hydrolase (beta-lactamase superfamily II)